MDVQFNIAIIEMVLFIAFLNYQREADTINMEMIFGKKNIKHVYTGGEFQLRLELSEYHIQSGRQQF